ncbi:MAG: nitroreductase family protein [Halobacteriovorax sp.]|nr:nitroreductase family protein [Halobacteriovorax sp.]
MKIPFKAALFNEAESLEISRKLAEIFKYRRTIREFSPEKPNRELIHNAIKVAGLAPSGANKQPWSFCVIENPELKSKIRKLSEIEERRFYVEKPNKKWLRDLKHLNLDAKKEFITTVPYLIAVFYRHFDLEEGEEKSTNYYAKESAGIATGMLISALHLSGLNCLTYTPKRMQFLGTLLDRPSEERPFMVLGVGLPHEDAMVPIITKKQLDQVLHSYQ